MQKGTTHPNSEFRENPSRSIYVTGRINQELVEKLTPAINQFRLSEPTPITAYIDSPGGSISSAETIRNLVTAPNPDGDRCRLITVVTGTAASAAADLLALGDYAIAYPHAEVVYHGSRQQTEFAMTSEDASSLASRLQQTNEFFASRLAWSAFPRFVLRISQLRNEFKSYIANPVLSTLTTALRKQLSSPNARLVRNAEQKQRIIGNLSTSVSKHLKRFKDVGQMAHNRFQTEILKGIVSYKLRLHKKEPWLLSEGGLQEVSSDFQLLHDFHFGKHRSGLKRFLKTYAELFLADEEAAEFKKLTVNEEEKLKWLEEKSEPKLRPLWYLMISLCRLLQTADYQLGAEEAYWLGLVDEVPGTSLPNLRLMAESLPQAAA